MSNSESKPIRAFLDISEARDIYGGSVAWWRKSVYLKRIPYYKRGARVVFSVSDLKDYFQRRRVPARVNDTRRPDSDAPGNPNAEHNNPDLLAGSER